MAPYNAFFFGSKSLPIEQFFPKFGMRWSATSPIPLQTRHIAQQLPSKRSVKFEFDR